MELWIKLYLHISNNRKQMEQRTTGGLWGNAKSTKQNKSQNKNIPLLFWAKIQCWSPTFHVKETTYQGPSYICLKNCHYWQRERKGWGREGKDEWQVMWAPPPPSRCMYLGAAKPRVILMSSAFCNLTWEFKSCLGFAFRLQGLTSPTKKNKKKKRGACWAPVSSRCQMHLTSCHKQGWVCFLQEKKKKKVIWQSALHFAAIFLAYEVVNGSLNSQMARTLVRVINWLLPLRDLVASSTWYMLRMSDKSWQQQTWRLHAWEYL